MIPNISKAAEMFSSAFVLPFVWHFRLKVNCHFNSTKNKLIINILRLLPAFD